LGFLKNPVFLNPDCNRMACANHNP